MLVLSRKRNERIIIHDRETNEKLGSFFIKSNNGGKYSLVFEVCESIGISRSEVYDRLTEKRKGA